MFETGTKRRSDKLSEEINIHYIEWCGRRHRTKTTRRDEFTITLSHSKRGAHHIDHHRYPMRGYQIHVVFPGQLSHFSILDHTIVCQLVIAKRSFDMLRFALRFNMQVYRTFPVQELTKPKFDILHHELKHIGNELYQDRPMFDVISSRARLTLQEISRVLEKKVSDRKLLAYPDKLAEFIDLVELHYKTEHSIAFYINKLNITQSHLASLTRKHKHITPTNIIKSRILEEAIRLLSQPSVTVKDVMLELGFTDQTVFNHFIKRMAGISPGTIKKNQNI